MKTQKFKKILILGVFLSLTGSWAFAEELNKEYHEEFDATENTVLKLQNKYGNIDVQNWDHPKVKVDVLVTVKHSNADRAQKMLDYIDVRFSTSGNTIEVVTIIDDKFSRSNNWNNGNDFDINYTVMMPEEISLDLYNKYGQVFVDEVGGLAKLEVKYGKLTVNKLSRGNVKPLNTVNLAYANGSSITECGWLKADIKYSGLNIDRVRAFVGLTSYMKLDIEEASSVVIEGKYDGYRFGKITNLVVNTAYSTIKVDELAEKLEADTKYTNVSIGYMPAEFKAININSKYGTYKIGLDDNASYKIEGEAGYSKIYYHEGGNVSRIQENTSLKVYGTVGNQTDPDAVVRVSTKYGNVKLND